MTDNQPNIHRLNILLDEASGQIDAILGGQDDRQRALELAEAIEIEVTGFLALTRRRMAKWLEESGPGPQPEPLYSA